MINLPILGLAGHVETKLYQRSHMMVRELDSRLINMLVKWNFIESRQGLNTAYYDGRKISYSGVGFRGSPRDVFWSGYIEGYIENESVSLLEGVADIAKASTYDIAMCVSEAANLLCVMVSRIYMSMADIERRLLGDGVRFPPVRDVSLKISGMQALVIQHSKIVVDMKSGALQKKSDNYSPRDVRDILEVKPGAFGIKVDIMEVIRRIMRYMKRNR